MKSKAQNFILTPDQQEAYDKFQGFLISDETEFHLFGAAGCGKTFLIQHFLSNGIKQYNQNCQVLGKTPFYKENIFLTATTNKAVEVLRQTIQYPNCLIDTVYSVFSVLVKEDLKTGDTYLTLKNSNFILKDSLVFIDECSMLPTQMLNIIKEHSKNCKIVYIGDSYQLAPINEKPHWDNTPALTTTRLYTPVRNQNQGALVKLCEQLRNTVDSLIFKPIKLVPGVIEVLDDSQAKLWIQQADYLNCKILAYTNTKAIKYINLIEQLKGMSFPYRVGETYINNTHWEHNHKSFYPEELVKIIEFDQTAHLVKDSKKIKSMYLYKLKVQSVANPKKVVEGYCPIDTEIFRANLRKIAGEQQWYSYFWFKQKVFDLRLPYACTVHKSQGNTYDEVLVDCGSFRVCDDPAMAARLLYVAVSRARNKVLFYGKLPKKYGEFV